MPHTRGVASPDVSVAPPGGFAVADLAAWLPGHWELRRTIVAPSGRMLARFTGQLEVVRLAPDQLHSYEHGTLVHQGRTSPAARELRYELHDGTATVRFDHGGWFHDLDLSTGHCEVVHPCGADTYHGCTEVLDPDRWVQVWQVERPTESYVSTTLATRGRTVTEPG